MLSFTVVLPVGHARTARRARPVRTIDIDLVNAEITNVLRLFAEVSGLNFVVGDEVRGKVTVRLRRVPWLTALSAILKTKGLGMIREGNIVRVASRRSLAEEREALLAERESRLRSGPLRTFFLRPSYSDARRLVPLVRGMLSKRGTVLVDQRTNTLIIRDVVDAR
jgi:type IV pilus assembly protein PilQ